MPYFQKSSLPQPPSPSQIMSIALLNTTINLWCNPVGIRSIIYCRDESISCIGLHQCICFIEYLFVLANFILFYYYSNTFPRPAMQPNYFKGKSGPRRFIFACPQWFIASSSTQKSLEMTSLSPLVSVTRANASSHVSQLTYCRLLKSLLQKIASVH